jgi:hypothetical protein
MKMLLDCGIATMLAAGVLLASCEVDPIPGWYWVHVVGLVLLALGGVAACWASKYARFRR